MRKACLEREETEDIGMKVAIVGSRDITETHYTTLCLHVPVGASEIISGGATGADALAVRYAHENGLYLTEYLPNYKKFGRNAPLKRNEEIVSRADYVLVLWNGHSKGSARVVELCLRTYTPVRLLVCKDEPHTLPDPS